MIEYRFVRGEKPAANEGNTLSGRAAPFNSETQIGGDKWGFREKISPGAFKKSIAERDIVLLDNHDMARPLARTSAKTLELSEKKDGLHFTGQPAETSYGRDVVINARSGNYGGMSFGFEVIKDSWQRGENGQPDLRTLEEVRLHEVSVVTFPAYGDTDVKVRDSIGAARESREKALGPIEPAEGGEDMTEGRKDSKKPYGDVAYADPKNGKYPIDTKEHADAAWKYINMPKNAEKYPLNGVSLASVKAKIKAACKKFGIKIDEANARLDSTECRFLLAFLDDERDSLSEDARAGLDLLMESVGIEARDADPYDDEFYERDSQDGDDDGSKADSQDKNKSDASGSDKGKAKNNCNTCEGKGKDKSGNTCAACGGSGHKNGDGKKHESGAGKEDVDGKKPSNQNNASGADEHRDSEPGSPTRTDDERRDALRALRARALRAANAEGRS